MFDGADIGNVGSGSLKSSLAARGGENAGPLVQAKQWRAASNIADLEMRRQSTHLESLCIVPSGIENR